jgi:hypothetical protein
LLQPTPPGQSGWNTPPTIQQSQTPVQFHGGIRDTFAVSRQTLSWDQKFILWLRGLSGKSPEIGQAVKSSNNGNSSGQPLAWLGVTITVGLLAWGAFVTHGRNLKNLEKNKKPNNGHINDPLPTQPTTTPSSSSSRSIGNLGTTLPTQPTITPSSSSSRSIGNLGTTSPLPQSLKSVSIATLFPSAENPRARRAMQYCFWGDAAGAPIENLSAAQINRLTPTLTQFAEFDAPKMDYTGYRDHAGKAYIPSYKKPGEPEVTDDSVMAVTSFIATKAKNSSDTICKKYFELLSQEYKTGLADRAVPESSGRRGFGGSTIQAINNPNMPLHQKKNIASNGAHTPPTMLLTLC